VIEWIGQILIEIVLDLMIKTRCVVLDVVHGVLPPLAVGIRLLSQGSMHHVYQRVAEGGDLAVNYCQIEVFRFVPENARVAGYTDKPELWYLHQQGNTAFVGQSATGRLASNGA
jgi:hypothetical protein